MDLLYGDGFEATRGDLALLGARHRRLPGRGTFCQALLARGRGRRRGVALGRRGSHVFVALELTLAGSEFHRVSVAFAAASTLIAVLLMAAVWRQRA